MDELEQFLAKLTAAHSLGVFDIDNASLKKLLSLCHDDDQFRKYLALLVEFRGFQAQLLMIIHGRKSD